MNLFVSKPPPRRQHGLLLWRPATLTGPAFGELTFCGLEVGEVPRVAVADDVRADDVEEPFGSGDPLAFADAAERCPHDPWDAEVSAVGVACCRVRHGRSPSVIAVSAILTRACVRTQF